MQAEAWIRPTIKKIASVNFLGVLRNSGNFWRHESPFHALSVWDYVVTHFMLASI